MLLRPTVVARTPLRSILLRNQMIRNKSVARQVSELMIEFSARIDRSILTVQENCSPEECKTYRLASAKILAEMLLEVMNPLYADHPDLKPAGMD